VIARIVSIEVMQDGTRRRRSNNIDADGLSFAGRLRYARQKRGWSQRELAERAALSVHAIRTAEGEQQEPRAHTLGLMAEALGCSMDWLWLGPEDTQED
jgi:transcriptional regulator with XRE-family HTH domain